MQAIKKSSKRRKRFFRDNNSGLTVFQRRIYETVRKIPKGRVATYKQIARAICKPGGARAVGNALNKNIFSDVPCHRVIRSDGTTGGYRWGLARKIDVLRSEGVKMKNKHIGRQFFIKIM